MNKYCAVLFVLFVSITVMTAENEKSSLSLVVEMKDTSSLIGRPEITEIGVVVSYASMKIPLQKINSLTLTDTEGSAILDLANGDKVTGKLVLKKMRLTGLYGTVELSVADIKRIFVRVSSGGVAAPNQFVISSVSGNCEVRYPGTTVYVNTGKGMTCPMGSTLKVRAASSMTVELGIGNTCTINANTEVVVGAASDRSRLADVELIRGTVSVVTSPGSDIGVVAADDVYSGKGAAFSLENHSQQSLSVLVLRNNKEFVSIKNDHYGATVGSDGSTVSISKADDRSFMRMKCLKGSLVSHMVDDNGVQNDTTIAPLGSQMVWFRESRGVLVITSIITDPDGITHPAIVTTKKTLR